MGPQASRWYESSAVEAVRLADSGSTIADARRAFERIARRAVPQAPDREISALVRAAEVEFRRLRGGGRLNFRAMERAANAMDRRMQLRAKAAMVSRELSKPCVFYAVSTHQRPRCAHRDLQGSVLYDRNFRQKVPWHVAKDVERYIRMHDLMSVQKAVRGPTWLIVSPYCRHRLFPLDTDEVLRGTANTVFKDGAHRSKTDAQRYREYRDRRKRIAVRASEMKKKAAR